MFPTARHASYLKTRQFLLDNVPCHTKSLILFKSQKRNTLWLQKSINHLEIALWDLSSIGWCIELQQPGLRILRKLPSQIPSLQWALLQIVNAARNTGGSRKESSRLVKPTLFQRLDVRCFIWICLVWKTFWFVKTANRMKQFKFVLPQFLSYYELRISLWTVQPWWMTVKFWSIKFCSSVITKNKMSAKYLLLSSFICGTSSAWKIVTIDWH